MSSKERRSFVSEIKHLNNGGLENIVLNSVTEIAPGVLGLDLPRFQDLPFEFESSGIDQYLTWLGELSENDENNREFGAYIHVSLDKGLIFPSNPTKGRNIQVPGEVKPFVVPVASQKQEEYYSAVTAHSHIFEGCFSFRDLEVIFRGTRYKKATVISLLETISTPLANYVLIKTKQTNPPNSTAKLKAKMKQEIPPITEEFSEWFKLLRDLTSELQSPNENMDFIKAMETSEFRGSIKNYLRIHYFTLGLAQKYSLGFYYSRKDGKYFRIEELDHLGIFLKDSLRLALTRFLRRLEDPRFDVLEHFENSSPKPTLQKLRIKRLSGQS